MNCTTKILAGLLALVLCTACTSDDEGGREMTLDIPVAIYSSSLHTAARADLQGDPGIKVDYKAPLYLYVFAFVAENNGSDYEVLTQKLTFTDTELASEWTLRDENTVNERWQKNVRVTFTISRAFHNELGKSRVFAIASRTDLGDLHTAVSAYTSMSQIEEMTLDMTNFTSDQLKDIYSTPTNDHSTPVASTDNGIIMSNGTTLTCSTVKLYHVAAKVDFMWEVASSLQQSVELKTITCTSLPTTCKVFEPTTNPTGTASALVLGSSDEAINKVNDGNKWLGRAYAFMLQPPGGTVNYTVTYGGTGNKADTGSSTTPDATVFSDVFTGWYRVIAEVK